MSVVDLGKVRGAQIYTGTAVTGTSGTGQIFEMTGITKAYVDDLYINVDNTSESKGNIYGCTVGGDAETAKWSYRGNLRGPGADVVNSLESTSTDKGLAAYQGKRLYDMLKEAGIFSKSCVVESTDKVYGLKVTIDNVTTQLTLTVDGTDYKYNHEKSGTATRTTVSISVGTAIGMANNGGVVNEIKTSNGYIYAYELLNASSVSILKKNMDLWELINKTAQGHEVSGEITDGTEVTKTGPVSKFLNGAKKLFYPITHSKAVWYNKSKGRTVYDEIADLLYAITEKAPKEHSSTTTAYGKGTKTAYGHVKLSDDTSSVSNETGGTAATPKAVKEAYDAATEAADAAKKKISKNGDTMSGAITFDKTAATEGMLKMMNEEELLELLRMISGDTPVLIINNGMYQNGKGTLNICAGTMMQLIISDERLSLENSGEADYSAHFRPRNDNKCTLGTSNRRFHSLWAGNATVQTSDAREKENIIPMDGAVTLDMERKTDVYSELFDRLNPVQYNFIGANRTCYGLIAQEVIEAMKELGIEDNELDLVHHKVISENGEEKETFGIAYANLIALLIHEVQKLKAK